MSASRLAIFPLIPAFSLREKENYIQPFVKSTAVFAGCS